MGRCLPPKERMPEVSADFPASDWLAHPRQCAQVQEEVAASRLASLHRVEVDRSWDALSMGYA